jgi:ribonuclease HI
MAKKGKFYVVWECKNPGIYDNWEDAKDQVTNVKNARYKSFTSRIEATKAFRSGANSDLEGLANLLLHLDDMEQEKQCRATRQPTAQQATRPVAQPARQAVDMPWRKIAAVDSNAIAVDASCLGNPGKMEYRGVDLATGREIFRVGVFEDSTNNIGEYLALVHVLALCKQHGVIRTIYTDSKTALAWLRRRGAKTQLKRTPRNERSFELLERADSWVRNNTWQNPVVKWDTDHWGEIPADFGRK